MTDAPIRVLEIPKWGLSMEEGTITEWLITEGDEFLEGDGICEIETEKVINTFEAPFGGTLRKILAHPGDTLDVQSVIAIVADEKVSDQDIDDFIIGFSENAAPFEIEVSEKVIISDTNKKLVTPVNLEPEQHISLESSNRKEDHEVHATPRAQLIATEHGLNLNDLIGSGRNNRISRGDVENTLKKLGREFRSVPNRRTIAISDNYQTKSILPTMTGITGKPLGSMRRTIADRLQASKQQIPHFRLVMDVCMDEMLDARKSFNQDLEGDKISINDFLVKTIAASLIKVPEVNIQFDGEKIYFHRNVDISIAVALDEGLITPIVKASHSKSLLEISREIRDLVQRAQSGKLKAEEFQGGTFCISNLGMYGVRQFDAIINPPQCAILAVGTTEQRMQVVAGEPQARNMMTLTLSCDHRVIDGAVGARFLKELKQYIENPTLMLL